MNTYNELVMPKNYAVVNEEEMTYVNGGFDIDVKWWGYYVYLNHSETQVLIQGQGLAGLAKYIPHPVAVLLYGESSYIASKDKGKGVRLKLRGHITPTLSGVSSR
jgi:hypothetical protein